jgi:hypothetical protein
MNQSDRPAAGGSLAGKDSSSASSRASSSWVVSDGVGFPVEGPGSGIRGGVLVMTAWSVICIDISNIGTTL